MLNVVRVGVDGSIAERRSGRVNRQKGNKIESFIKKEAIEIGRCSCDRFKWSGK